MADSRHDTDYPGQAGDTPALKRARVSPRCTPQSTLSATQRGWARRPRCAKLLQSYPTPLRRCLVLLVVRSEPRRGRI